MQKAAVALCTPLEPHFSPGGARVRLGSSAAYFSRQCQEMEGFCRLLWCLVPFWRGGGVYSRQSVFQEGLIHGTDPKHPEFWGHSKDYDQRLVETAPIAFALTLLPEVFWTPLSKRERSNLVNFLLSVNRCNVRDNNWLFFRVLVNMALALRGSEYSASLMKSALDRLESFHLGDGWYSDGPAGPCDFYSSFAFQFYALIYSVWAKDIDRERVERFRLRASAFAKQFSCWFAADGSAVPYGRSLTYRFAQGAFWGALAYGDVEEVSSGVARGMLLRNMRWWVRRPIFSETGLLTVGYGYDGRQVAEKYVSPSSPYWALKSFLPLALDSAHPFWLSEEEVPEVPARVVQERPQVIVCRENDHVVAFCGARSVPRQHKHSAEKYSKFCYSNRFGFGLSDDSLSLSAASPDSMLAVSLDGEHFRVRTHSVESRVSDGILIARWESWPDVEITTWLIPFMPWHVRVHLLSTSHRLFTVEGGFSAEVEGEPPASQTPVTSAAAVSIAKNDRSVSVIRNLHGIRSPGLIEANPNTHVLFPRSVIPALLGEIEPGVNCLACAVAGVTDTRTQDDLMASVPVFEASAGTFRVSEADGNLLYAASFPYVNPLGSPSVQGAPV